MFLLGFLTRRLAQGAVIVLLVTFLIFTLLRVIPGDPVRLMVGGMAPDTLVEQIAEEMGLREGRPEDKPLLDIFASLVVERVEG